MKKMIAMGLAAMALLAVAQQQASAWSKCKFAIGMKFGFEGGGNSILWGMFKGAQVPGYHDDHGHHGHHGHHDGHMDHGDHLAFASASMAPEFYPHQAFATLPYAQQ